MRIFFKQTDKEKCTDGVNKRVPIIRLTFCLLKRQLSLKHVVASITANTFDNQQGDSLLRMTLYFHFRSPLYLRYFFRPAWI